MPTLLHHDIAILSYTSYELHPATQIVAAGVNECVFASTDFGLAAQSTGIFHIGRE
jgi:hypothetical protein